MSRVIVLNADFSFHAFMKLDKAIKNILKGTVEIIFSDKTKTIKCFSGDVMPFPKVIKLVKYVRRMYVNGIPPTKKNILIRDKYICAYCGKYGNEVEHIHPKSEGGIISWENSVCSCSKCNRKKGNKTLSQAKMYIKYCKPVQPTVNEFLIKYTEVFGIKKMLEDLWKGEIENTLILSL